MSIPMNDIQSGCRFYPVQCSERTLQGLTPQEGHVYFTTDSKKIYLARRNTDQSMILDSMCSSTGFYYGTKEIQYDNTGNTPDPNVIFSLDEIEGDGIPLIDDLILNVDGCFYRVKNVDVDIDEVRTERLTLQGSGVGGGGGGYPSWVSP